MSIAPAEDAAVAFAQELGSLAYGRIPAEVVQLVKFALLDTVGNMVAGAALGQGVAAMVELATESAGTPESTIVGFGQRTSALMAAFANGAMAHALDFDDTHYDAAVHPSGATVPAALALAERRGAVSGRALISAVCAGNEVTCRIGLAMARRAVQRPGGLAASVWMESTVFGVFGAAMACGHVLSLRPQQIVDALGIALHQAAGTLEMAFGTGSALRGLYAAFPAKAGLLSALLAAKGIAGSPNSLEGQAGFFQAYYGGDFDRSALLADLGERFEYAGVSFKPWPSCAQSHPHVDATIGLVKEHDIPPQQIVQITLQVADRALKLCVPLAERQAPKSAIEAKFSIPFAVAIAAAKRNLTLDDFSPEALQDPTTLGLAQRIRVEVDPQLMGRKTVPSAVVAISTTQGETFTQRVDVPYGFPQKPLSEHDLERKFISNLAQARAPRAWQMAEQVWDAVMHLERMDDIRALMALLA